MLKETYFEIIRKLKNMGVKTGILRKIKPDSTYFETIYNEMKVAYSNYYIQLQYDDFLSEELQQKIDMNLCISLYLARKKMQGDESVQNEKLEFLNAIKAYLVDQMKSNDLFIIDSIIFDDANNLDLIFDTPELKKILNEYLRYGKNKLDELTEKYNDKTISVKEKIILMRLLSSEIIEKDKAFVDQIFKDIYIKEKLTNYEEEFLIRYISKQKCADKNIKYVKAYLFESAQAEYGGFYTPSTHYICIKANPGDRSGRNIAFNVLHEYEHYCQNLDSLSGKLNINSLAEAFYYVFFNHFSKKEYKRNYDFTDIELYANEAANNESMMLFIKNKMFLLNRNSPTGKIRPTMTKFWDSIMRGIKRDENNKAYTINNYNVYHLEKALRENEEYLKEQPILEIFYNRKEKCIKNIQELSDEYAKQDANGRETFIPFVEYQIANNGLDLDKIEFDSLTDEEKINILFLIAKHFKNLFARIFLYIKNIPSDPIANKQVFEEEIEIFAKELAFLKRNSEYIESIKNNWELKVSEKTIESEFHGMGEKINNLFMKSVYENFHFYHTDSLLTLSRYINENIPKLMAEKLSTKGNESIKGNDFFENIPIDDKRKKFLEKLATKIETISLDYEIEKNGSSKKI